VKNDLIVVVGSMLSLDDKKLFEDIKDSRIALLSVLEDLPLMGKVEFFSRYEAGSEEGVVAILAKELLKDTEIPSRDKQYFDELDEGYISAETNIGEEEVEELHAMIQEATSPIIIFGKDIFLNSRIENISKFINLISKYSGIEVKCLGTLKQTDDGSLEEVEELDSFDGAVIFEYNSNEDNNLLVGSPQFGVAAKVQDGQMVVVENQNREFKLDKKLKGTIALMANEVNENSYRFKVVKITKREVQ
jgi:NADH-quinone oxidoreductase subunit F